MNKEAIIELLTKMGDDALIIGHRNSEWTGLGPILEEDIAFSSIAQDKIGHAQALYQISHTFFGLADPDVQAFQRDEKSFKSCHLVEYPIGEYDFSIMRQFLFDRAELLRYESLTNSSFEPLAQLAKKVKGEIKYHVMHGDTWITQLAQGTEESKAKMQSALNEVYPMALAIFEEGEHESSLINDGIFIGEKALREQWIASIAEITQGCGLSVPSETDASNYLGGRKGFHSEHLQPLLEEMTEVLRIDPSAEW